MIWGGVEGFKAHKPCFVVFINFQIGLYIFHELQPRTNIQTTKSGGVALFVTSETNNCPKLL